MPLEWRVVTPRLRTLWKGVLYCCCGYRVRFIFKKGMGSPYFTAIPGTYVPGTYYIQYSCSTWVQDDTGQLGWACSKYKCCERYQVSHTHERRAAYHREYLQQLEGLCLSRGYICVYCNCHDDRRPTSQVDSFSF